MTASTNPNGLRTVLPNAGGGFAVQGAEIASATIDNTNIAAGGISSANIANLAITTGLIAANAVTAAKIANNTVDSGQIATTLLQHVQVPLSSANILAMYGAPVQLIAAPAAGKNIIVQQVFFTMVTTSTGYAAGGAVGFQLDNTVHGAGTLTTATIASGVITAGAGTSYTIRNGVDYTGTAAKGLFISNDTAAFTTGTGTALVDIWYRIV